MLRPQVAALNLMSVGRRQHDKYLVSRMLNEAVRWFHDARKHPENEGKELSVLARECANGAFQNHALAIPVQRREIVARKFMEACAERFSYEVPKAAADKPELVH